MILSIILGLLFLGWHIGTDIRENRDKHDATRRTGFTCWRKNIGSKHTGCTKFLTATWRVLTALLYTDIPSDDYYSWREFGRTLVHRGTRLYRT